MAASSVPDCRELVLFQMPSIPPQRRSYPKASLLGLPVEIRLQIYSYLLSPSPGVLDPLALHTWTRTRHPKSQCWKWLQYFCERQCPHENVQPQVLSTCRQVLEEAIKLLYTDIVYHLVEYGPRYYTQAHFPALPTRVHKRVGAVTIVGSAAPSSARVKDHLQLFRVRMPTARRVLELLCLYVAGSFSELKRVQLRLDAGLLFAGNYEKDTAIVFDALKALSGSASIQQIDVTINRIVPWYGLPADTTWLEALEADVRQSVPDCIKIKWSHTDARVIWKWQSQYAMEKELIGHLTAGDML